ncbi:hypothetical protein [Dactylosporangium sp. NPDC051484]|uniref:hypothetical protein n=1 Tax=Dactylosporangium sp. NPDC051484 TaxID=3154942 RepID=UPI00344F1D34
MANRQHAASGPALHRFLAGYQFSLVVGAALVALGVPIALVALRRIRTPEPPAAGRPEPELQQV